MSVGGGGGCVCGWGGGWVGRRMGEWGEEYVRPPYPLQRVGCDIQVPFSLCIFIYLYMNVCVCVCVREHMYYYKHTQSYNVMTFLAVE